MDNNGGGGDSSMISQNNSDLDSLSNLLINSYEDDAAALDQYESELEQDLQENLILEKEQSNQRLFQSFQTSACAVAQMFKDKSSQNSVMSSWESFQNSAGAITVLYKDSLEACRVHMELGIHLGQQRKLKEIINWIKKKKKRSIRKDELISFLIGKQYPSQNQMFNLFNHQTANNNPFNSNLNMNTSSSQQHTSASNCRHRSQQFRSRNNSLISTSSNSSNVNTNINPINTNSSNNTNNTNTNVNNISGNATSISSVGGVSINPTISQLNLINNGDNSNGSEVETNSDLATFREALIMHNRTRDTPMNRTHTTAHHHHHHQNHNTQSHNHNNNNHNHNHHSSHNTNQPPQTAAGALNTQQNCDDLDCFFCEQIATHIEHKRSSANLNFDMESPTRKRTRFY